MSVTTPEQISVRLDWRAAETCAAEHVNQSLAQTGPPSSGGIPDGIYLALGSLAPPVIPSDDAGKAARIAELTGSELTVAVHGRFHLGRETLDDLIRVLQTTAEQYDAAVAAARPQEGRP